MGRAFYSHESEDPDLDWLITNFLSERSNYIAVETESNVPYTLIQYNIYEQQNPKNDKDSGELNK
ncbi:MAG: hypothetical protein LBE20_02665 [Deltaproteobacteria bacterium]|nr:hypothetical protein [Deltaproteobacteria bacterium]